MQNVINEAHRKVADALVHGERIRIAGETSNFWKKFLAAVKNLGFLFAMMSASVFATSPVETVPWNGRTVTKGDRQFHLG